MSRRVVLPAEPEIREAIARLTAADPARPPTVVALARSLGLANATFWRHFPHIAQEVADLRRGSLRSPRPAEPSASADTDDSSAVARLRGDNARLRGQLEAAVAHIQHLTLENLALREELERARKVVRIPSR